MRTLFRFIRAQFLGATALVVSLATVGSAATGNPLLLGSLNRADQTTILRNTDIGPALELKAKAGQPALKVNTSTLVARLNAARLGGKLPGAYALAAAVYTKAAAEAKFALAGAAYTRDETDGRFMRSLLFRAVTGTSNGLADNEQLHSQPLSVPGAGFVMVVVEASHTAGTGGTVALTFGGSPRGQITTATTPQVLTSGIFVPSATTIEPGLSFTSANANPSTASVKFSVIFVPNP